MLLRIENLTAGYGRILALRGVSLHVEAGEIVTLIGANGAGKSTLLAAIAGTVPARSGRLLHEGRDLAKRRPERRVRDGIALVPEGRQIFAPMTVEENLLLGGYTRGRAERREDLAEIYERFPRLAERRKQAGGTLSGGEQQMMAIGRALMSRPRLLLLDEPSMGLAPRIARDIFQSLQSMRREDLAVLVVEQNAMLALRSADRGYVLETGQVVLEGDCKTLANNDDVQRAYLGRGYQEGWE